MSAHTTSTWSDGSARAGRASAAGAAPSLVGAAVVGAAVVGAAVVAAVGAPFAGTLGTLLVAPFVALASCGTSGGVADGGSGGGGTFGIEEVFSAPGAPWQRAIIASGANDGPTRVASPGVGRTALGGHDRLSSLRRDGRVPNVPYAMSPCRS
jgi:hypothetical protein